MGMAWMCSIVLWGCGPDEGGTAADSPFAAFFPYVCDDDSGRPGAVADGTEGSACGYGPPACEEGLRCNFGCTDDLGSCGGTCTPADDARAFCRQGRCTDGDECDAWERCEADGFCYPSDF